MSTQVPIASIPFLEGLNTIPFEYLPLDLQVNEIRLLTLDPGEQSIQLTHHHLTPELEYSALSYTWGPTSDLIPIIVNDTDLWVTKNLAAALQHLRASQKPLRIWIDAICINQKDPLERNHQVQQMRSIFGSAEKVIIWLGEAADGSDQALEFLEQASQGKGLFFGEQTKTPDSTWEALRKLWARPYWSRMWIVQELAAAIDPESMMLWLPKFKAELRCGDQCISFDTLQTAWNFLSRYKEVYLVRGEGEYEPVASLSKILLDYSQKRIKLGNLLISTSESQATDPLDKLYALHGLVSNQDREATLPDYTATLQIAYGKAIKHVIQTEKSLSILSSNRFERSSAHELPSWMPSLASDKSSAQNWRHFEPNFRASHKHAFRGAEFSEDFRTITVQGFHIDTVVAVPPFPDSSHFDDPSSELEQKRAGTSYWNYMSTLSLGHHFQSDPPLPKPGYGIKNWNKYLRLIETDPEVNNNSDEARFYRRIIEDRSLFFTKAGRVGLGPYFTQPGDEVVVLIGSNMCSILRTVNGEHKFLGDAYVHGEMQRERGRYIAGMKDFVLR